MKVGTNYKQSRSVKNSKLTHLKSCLVGWGGAQHLAFDITHCIDRWPRIKHINLFFGGKTLPDSEIIIGSAKRP